MPLLALLMVVSAQTCTSGNPSCPCSASYEGLNMTNLDPTQGLMSTLGSDGNINECPHGPGYGLHSCNAHDARTPPYCKVAGFPSWCSSPWYHASDCNISNSPPSFYGPVRFNALEHNGGRTAPTLRVRGGAAQFVLPVPHDDSEAFCFSAPAASCPDNAYEVRFGGEDCLLCAPFLCNTSTKWERCGLAAWCKAPHLRTAHPLASLGLSEAQAAPIVGRGVVTFNRQAS